MTSLSLPALIERKKRGMPLSADEWGQIVRGFTAGEIPDYQMAALLMAARFRGLTQDETVSLTEAMMRSGQCLRWDHLSVPTVDKHSTGGVGDKVSLALAPLVAAAGVAVPMVSGRGLGHTGGTLDKLAAIPGFRTHLSLEEFRLQVERIGCAITGQSRELAPADGKIYALRDVTATVYSIPLIAASIMSKKLAAGPGGIVFDVKVGRGAFMEDIEHARDLARLLIGIGEASGRRCCALLTDMDQPLGLSVGNALEAREAVELLHGRGPEDLAAVTLALAAEMLVLTGMASGPLEGWKKACRVRDSGAALERFAQMVAAQGGNPAVAHDPSVLPSAPVVRIVEAPHHGVVTRIDARAIGDAARVLGAGRLAVHDEVDPRVGIVLRVKEGADVERGQPLAEIHAPSEAAVDQVLPTLRASIHVGETPEPPRPLIRERITGGSVAPWSMPEGACHD